MRPTIQCSECKQDIRWGDQFCGNCGQPVEWPSGRSERSQPKRERKDRQPAGSESAASWKMMLGVAIFLVSGVIILEMVTGSNNVPTGTVGSVQSGTSANMEAMTRLNELEQIANANPSDLKARLTVANFAHDNRLFDKAIENYKLYLDRNPTDPDALVDLGICYNDQGDLDQAKTFMERALKESPKHLLAHFNLGIVSLRIGDLKAANDWFKKTVAISPESEVGRRAQQLLSEHLNAGQ